MNEGSLMQKSKNAFTMIELIFVIVILGILATVAIPKLSATRNDAQIAKAAQNIAVAISEISTYAVATGKIKNDLSTMSNAIGNLVTEGVATLDTANKKATIAFGSVSDCLSIQVISGVNDENLSVLFGNPANDIKCLNLQSKIDVKKYEIKLRGQYVEQ